ncbi:Sugar phosphate isomerase/epimerase [Spirosomataceae bacterium TFI 002]|nr:Sugar phosphate isomerase/epimerase [Spirosomataceae bacterium TFI 002]
MFQLGFVSAILAEKSFTEVIDFVADNGFESVEIMCWPGGSGDARRYAGVTHIDVDKLDVDFVKTNCQQKGVAISGLGYYPNPLDADKVKSEYYIEHIKKIIKACNRLSVPVMNTFIGRNQHLSMEENLLLFKELWKPIIAVAEQEGVKIGIENCPMYFTQDEWPGGKNLAISPKIWDYMFETFSTPLFGLNYDPSHMILQHMDEISPIYNYKERLHHIHLKDVKIYKEKLDKVGVFAHPLEFHSPKLPGFGDVRWGQFFAALTDIRYRGPVVIEVEDKAFEGSEEDVHKAILTSRNYIKQFLP